MTINTTIDTKRKLVMHEISNKLTIDEIMEAYTSLYSDSSFTPSMDILINLQPGSTSALSSDDVHRLVTVTRQFADQRGHGKSAIVAHNTSDFGMSHVVEFLLKDEAREVRVFENMDGAKQWLGL